MQGAGRLPVVVVLDIAHIPSYLAKVVEARARCLIEGGRGHWYEPMVEGYVALTPISTRRG